MMFSTLIDRAVRLSKLRQVWASTTGATMATLLLIAPLVASAQTAADFETPPVLHAKDLVPATMLTGKGFRVANQVPTDGFMAIFTITTDAGTFRNNAGTFQVRSRELFAIRLAELSAIAQLEDVSKTKTFATAMAAATARPIESAGNMVLHPIGTVEGLPGGVGRLFGRVEGGAEQLWNTASASDQSGLERTEDAAKQAGTITRDALGYEQERRNLAKKLGVDPYTKNPVLAKKLDDVAWVSFAGRFIVSTAISVAVPASMIITSTVAVNNLIWDTPRADLIVRVTKKLQELQVPEDRIQQFMHNAAIPLSVQVALVEHLTRLSGVSGRAGVIGLMDVVLSESQARFLAGSVRMLADYHETQQPIVALAAPGPVIGRDRDGTVIVPAPVDYVSWTEGIAQFATSPTLAAPQRSIWLTGKMSPRAKREFAGLGWTVRESTQGE